MTPTEPATTAITSMPSTAAQASLYQQLNTCFSGKRKYTFV